MFDIVRGLDSRGRRFEWEVMLVVMRRSAALTSSLREPCTYHRCQALDLS